MATEPKGITIENGKVVASADDASAEGGNTEEKAAEAESEASQDEKGGEKEAVAESGAEKAEGASGEESDENPLKPATKKTPWYERRIAELTAINKRNTQENQILKLALEAKDKVEATAAGDDKPKPLTDKDVERRAQEIAAQALDEQEFTKTSNDIYDKGVGEFQDFAASLLDLRESVGGLTKPFIEALAEHEFPHRVLYELAKDKDEAARIMSLSTIKMAAAIARKDGIEPKKANPKISGAPPPVKPVKPAAKSEKSYDDMTAEEFAEARDESERKKRESRYR